MNEDNRKIAIWKPHTIEAILFTYYECTNCSRNTRNPTPYCPICGCYMIKGEESEAQNNAGDK